MNAAPPSRNAVHFSNELSRTATLESIAAMPLPLSAKHRTKAKAWIVSCHETARSAAEAGVDRLPERLAFGERRRHNPDEGQIVRAIVVVEPGDVAFDEILNLVVARLARLPLRELRD
jgi:hypothetical protein